MDRTLEWHSIYVAQAVVGITASFKRRKPNNAFINVLFPELNSPITAK
jgi:hypothetical protein